MSVYMERRVFTLQEADSMVAGLNESFARIFSLNEKIRTVSKDVQELMGIWGGQVLESDNPDNRFYFEKLRDRENMVQELRDLVEELQKSGCVIKSMNEGVVDFYYRRGEELVFLCWKYGEDKIKFWHSLNESFGERKPVDELLQMKSHL